MNSLQTTIRSTPQFRSRPPDYFITSPTIKPGVGDGDGEEPLRIPMYNPSSYDPLGKDDLLNSHIEHSQIQYIHPIHSHPHLASSFTDSGHHHHHHHHHHHDSHADPSKSSHRTPVEEHGRPTEVSGPPQTKSGKMRLPNTKTIQQFHSYMSNLGVLRDDHDKIGMHLHQAAVAAEADGDKSKFITTTFPTKRLITIHGSSLLTALKGVAQKLEILAVLPQIMSRLAVGDVELEDVLGPECTDAILQLLYIQMAWLKYRCPQPEPGANFMGKTLHQIKRRLQKGVRAKLTKLKFPNALSVERLERVKEESVYDIQDNISRIEQVKSQENERILTSGPSLASSEFEDSASHHHVSDFNFYPSQTSPRVCSTHHKNPDSSHTKIRKCKKEVPMTETERKALQRFIDGEAERTEQRTNMTMRSLMKKALNVDPSAAERVFHDIFFDTVIQSRPHPSPQKSEEGEAKPQVKRKSVGERALEKYRELHQKKRHRPDCRKCRKHPEQCLVPPSKPTLAVGKRSLRPNCLRFALHHRHRQDHGEIEGEGAEFDGWGPDYNPLDEFLSDTELDEEEEEAYQDCVKSLEANGQVNQSLRKISEGQHVHDSEGSPRKVSQPKDEGHEKEVADGKIAEPIRARKSTLAKSDKKSVGQVEPEDAKNATIAIPEWEGEGEDEYDNLNQRKPYTIASSEMSKDGSRRQTMDSDVGSQRSRRTTLDSDIPSREDSTLDLETFGRQQHERDSYDDLEFDIQGRLIASPGIPQSRLIAVSKLLAAPAKSKFLSRLIGVTESKKLPKKESAIDKNLRKRHALQKKRLHLVKRALGGAYGKHVRKALKDKNVKELLFLIQLDRNNREDQIGNEGGDEEDTQPKSPPHTEEEEKRRRFRKIFESSKPHHSNSKDRQPISSAVQRATWRERWYGRHDENETEDPNQYPKMVHEKIERGWRLVRETMSRLCLVKQWKDIRGNWQTRKIRLNKDNRPETFEERKHRLLKKMNRKLEREKRIKELQEVFGQEIPRIAYEKYDRENHLTTGNESRGELKAKFLCTPSKSSKRTEDEEEDCELPKYRMSSDDSKSSSEEEEEYRIVVTDPYPFNNPLSRSIQSAKVSTANSSKRPRTGLAETIGIPEHSESYKLGSIRMLTANYNIGRMAALEMPWIGPELFGISSDQYNSEQLKAAYREVLRLICLNDNLLQWISQQIKPEVTQAVKVFYAQIQVLQGLMYARLLMSPQEEVTRISYLKQTWIREQRLLRLHKTLDDELAKLEKEREEMMVTLNESINNFIGQIDHAYLQCHQEIVKTIAEYTKMELVTTKSADHALQELHGTLQKCIIMASIMRAKFAEAENKLQKNRLKLLADLEALISQYDSEMFGRQEVLDQLGVDEETNKQELNRLDEKLKRVERRYAMMQEDLKLKEDAGKSKKRKKKSKKGKKKKKGKRSKKGKKSKRSKSRGRKGKKKKSKKDKTTSDEESSEYEEGEEGDTSAAEGSKGKKKKKGKSKSKSKSPKGDKESRKDSGSTGLGSDAEVEVTKKGRKRKGGRSKGGKGKKVKGKPGDKTTSGEDESGLTEEEEEAEEDTEGQEKGLTKTVTIKAKEEKGGKGKKGRGKKEGKKAAAVKPKSGKSSARSSAKASVRSSKAEITTDPKEAKENGDDFDEPPTPPEPAVEGTEIGQNSKAKMSTVSVKEESKGSTGVSKKKKSKSKKKKGSKGKKSSKKGEKSPKKKKKSKKTVEKKP